MPGTGDDFSREVRAGLDVACKNLAPRLEGAGRPIVAISMVRNECDVIERFVRHALGWADAVVLVDHSSTDGTEKILQGLCREDLPLAVVPDRAIGFHQSARITDAAIAAARQLRAGVLVPLDADEFLVDTRAARPAEALRTLRGDDCVFVPWRPYVPTISDTVDEPDVLKRITMRIEAEPPSLNKTVIVGGAFAQQPDFWISSGNHAAFVGPSKYADGPVHAHLRLAHFPIRSATQFACKIATKFLCTPLATDRSPGAGWHYHPVTDRFPHWQDLSREELQWIAERYAIRENLTSCALVHDPVSQPACPLRYYGFASPDPFKTVYGIARQLSKHLTPGAGMVDEFTQLRQIITAANRDLRQSLARIAQLCGVEAGGLSLEQLEAAIENRILALQDEGGPARPRRN